MEWTRRIDKVGNLRQIAGTRHVVLAEGACAGVRAIDVKTGGGLEYTLLPDRGLDISQASFRGTNLTYLSAQAEVHPSFYSCEREEWLRTFFGGLLTTCGPTHFGPPCSDQGDVLGLHGRHTVTPAVSVCDNSDVAQGEICITARIEQFVMFGEKISLKRSIRSKVGENRINLKDEVTNHDGKPTACMLLYHVNFGYPLLDSDSVAFVNSTGVVGCDDCSERDLANLWSFSEPDANSREKNYTHTFEGKERGYASLYNRRLGYGVAIRFDATALPYLTQWKMQGVRDYVLALEPCNAPCLSRRELREAGVLPMLEAGETKTNELEFELLTDEGKG